MGIAPYKYFTFDGASSRLYDVYLTGEGVFNAPERAVNMIEIPGRNGNYALDQGKFDNITVTYKAGIVDASESNFADKMSAVRNWLCSKVGYKRLEDDYNPNEFRMAVFKSGVKVDHEDLSTGEFDITFECKPQRWLTSGETATAVANNGTLSNPTLFDASPLLEVKGHGDIDIGGQPIKVENQTIGIVQIGEQTAVGVVPITQTLDVSALNNGDTFTVSGAEAYVMYNSTYSLMLGLYSSYTFTNCSAVMSEGTNKLDFAITSNAFSFTKGTASTKTFSVSGPIIVNTTTVSITLSGSIAYDGDSTLTYDISATAASNTTQTKSAKGPDIYGTSTKTVSNSIYIDMDIGEAYSIINGATVSVNNLVQLPSDLPILPPGSTTFTYDNTFTEFKVTPRWWKV